MYFSFSRMNDKSLVTKGKSCIAIGGLYPHRNQLKRFRDKEERVEYIKNNSLTVDQIRDKKLSLILDQTEPSVLLQYIEKSGSLISFWEIERKFYLWLTK